MKAKENIRVLQKRNKTLEKARHFLQQKLEKKNNDDATTVHILAKIRAIDLERYSILKVCGGLS